MMTQQLIVTGRVIGHPVTNHQAENLGQIHELVMDQTEGCIRYAIVKFDSFYGFGGRLVAVPWKQLQWNASDASIDALILDMDRSRFQHAPGFDSDDWPDMDDPGWRETVARYFGAEVPEAASGGEAPKATRSYDW